jgi:hypothetical protein
MINKKYASEIAIQKGSSIVSTSYYYVQAHCEILSRLACKLTCNFLVGNSFLGMLVDDL